MANFYQVEDMYSNIHSEFKCIKMLIYLTNKEAHCN